jgi:hypothetical protein
MSNCDCERCQRDREYRDYQARPNRPDEPEIEFTLTLSEAKALYRELEKSYINQENVLAVDLIMNLGKFVDRFGK